MEVSVQIDPHAEDPPPLSFTLGSAEHTVRDVVDRWFGANATFFKVVAGDGNVYILRHDSAAGNWTLESFRASSIV